MTRCDWDAETDVLARTPAGRKIGEGDVCCAEGGERGEEGGCRPGLSGAEEVVEGVKEQSCDGVGNHGFEVVHALMKGISDGYEIRKLEYLRRT